MRTVLAIVLTTGASSGIAFAEEPAPLEVDRGTRVRIMLAEAGPIRQWVTGRLIESSPGTLTVASLDGEVVVVPRDEIATVAYHVRGRDRGKGAKIGAAITGAAGLIAGGVLAAKESEGSCDQCGMAVMIVGVAAAVPGAAIGYAIGVPDAWWEPAPAARIGVSARGRRVAFAIRVGAL
jgi:hypothetical protein